MIIKTTIIYQEEDPMGINSEDEKKAELLLDLNEVSGIMPADKENKNSIVFLQGRDIMVQYPYKSLILLWFQTKKAFGTDVSEDLQYLKKIKPDAQPGKN